MSLDPNFESYIGGVLACGIGAVAIGTPVLWRALRRRPRPTRLLLTSLGSVALAGLAGLTVEAVWPIVYEMLAGFSLALAMLLQVPVLPVLVFLSRRRSG